MKTVTCLWCSHTETGDGHAPHDAIEAHQADTHGRRKLPCGCQYVPNDRPESVFRWWTCDGHSAARIYQVTALQIANHDARRWVTEGPDQPSLFAGART